MGVVFVSTAPLFCSEDLSLLIIFPKNIVYSSANV